MFGEGKGETSPSDFALRGRVTSDDLAGVFQLLGSELGLVVRLGQRHDRLQERVGIWSQ